MLKSILPSWFWFLDIWRRVALAQNGRTEEIVCVSDVAKDLAKGSHGRIRPEGVFSFRHFLRGARDPGCNLCLDQLRIAAHRLQIRSLRHRSTGQDNQYRKKFHRQILARKATVFERMTGKQESWPSIDENNALIQPPRRRFA